MRALAILASAACLTLLAACTPNATSQTAAVSDTVTWTNPTANTDGSALTDLASVRLQWGTVSGGPYSTGSLVVTDTTAAPVTTATIPRAGTGVGTLCYVAVAVSAAGQQSAPSNEACKTVAPPPPTPNAPTGLAAK